MIDRTNEDRSLRQYTTVLAALVLTCAALYFGRGLFMLLFASGLFAFLLLPLCKALERRGFPVWLAALTCCLLILLLGAALAWFLGWQYGHFARDLPQLREGLNEKFASVQAWLNEHFHFSLKAQDEWSDQQMSSLSESGGSIAMGLFSATGAVLAIMLLIPIFTFLLLLLKDKFHTFFSQLGQDNGGTVLRVVVRSAELSRKYLRGVLTVMVIISVLNSIGFLLLGLKYAIVLGITAAIFNVVPYVGPWIGGVMPILIALITKDSMMYAAGAMGVILLSQFIDNNFITPKIVGSAVSINPLASIVALLAGGMLWGVAGLILAIPLMGMLKAICDEVPGLKPWGYLLGEERDYPEEGMIKMPFTTRPTGASKPRVSR